MRAIHLEFQQYLLKGIGMERRRFMVGTAALGLGLAETQVITSQGLGLPLRRA